MGAKSLAWNRRPPTGVATWWVGREDFAHRHLRVVFVSMTNQDATTGAQQVQFTANNEYRSDVVAVQ